MGSGTTIMPATPSQAWSTPTGNSASSIEFPSLPIACTECLALVQIASDQLLLKLRSIFQCISRPAHCESRLRTHRSSGYRLPTSCLRSGTAGLVSRGKCFGFQLLLTHVIHAEVPGLGEIHGLLAVSSARPDLIAAWVRVTLSIRLIEALVGGRTKLFRAARFSL